MALLAPVKPEYFTHSTEAATVRAVVDECRRQGLDDELLLETGPLCSENLEVLDRRLPVEIVYDVWANALTLTGDPLLGLHAAEHLPFGAFGVPDFIAANAPTVREGLARLCRYFRIITSGGTLHLEERDDELRLIYADCHEPIEMTGQVVDFSFTCVIVRFRLACGDEFAPREVWFRHDAPAELKEYTRVFRAPLRFGAACDALLFDPESVNCTMPRASLHLSAILEKVGDEQLAKLPDETHVISQRIRQVLDDGFNHGDDRSMSDVASQMGMSQRTLQRRLSHEGSTFKEVREQVRHELACTWLRQPQVAIGEVAFLLGFSEPSAFHRAFKRWSGQTPATFRALEASGA